MKKLFLLFAIVPYLLTAGTNKDSKVTSEHCVHKEQKTKRTKPVKMILDLDTGIDDAMALAYAVANPDIELIGVVTTFGNVATQTSIDNTLALLELLEQKDIPVFRGADRAINATDIFVANDFIKTIHGNNGIGNIDISKSKRSVEKESGVDFIVESVKKHGKDLYIVATGPTTNLSQAIAKDPKIGQKVGKIVIMGGALIVEGNVTRFAEANIYKDAVAANDLFLSGTPFTMVGLDVTMRTTLTKADTQKWRDLGTASGKAFADMVDFYINSYAEKAPGIGGCALHDPLAVAVAIHPEYVSTLKLPMKVTTGKENWGRTISITEKLNDPSAANVEVAVDIKVKDFVDPFKADLTELFKKH